MTGSGRRLGATIRPAVALLCALGCEQSARVGSACPQGACDTGAVLDGMRCLVGDTSIGFTYPAGVPVPGLAGLCLPRPLPRTDRGLVECSLTWWLPSDGSAISPCQQLRFARPDGSTDELGRVGCVINQLAAFDGELADRAGSGWYYDDFGMAPECGGARIAFNGTAVPPDRVEMELRCSTATVAASRTDAGVAMPIASDMCARPLRDSSAVGDRCEPSVVPEGGFDEREIYLDVGNTRCGSSACLVYRLRGNPRSDCDPGSESCSDPEETLERTYCSCRCRLPDGEEGATCVCGRGFSCVDVLEEAPDGIRGGYCVRDGTISMEG